MDKISALQCTMSPAHLKPLPPVPTMRPEEIPEREQEYTKESLLKFKEDQAARESAERLAAAGGGEGGFFGGFGGGGGDEEEKEKEGVEEDTDTALGAGEADEVCITD